MKKHYTWATAGLLVVAVTLAAISLFNTITPVSAQQIIERAAAAQSAAQTTLGIKHYRIEIYKNPLAEEGNQAGATTITESYLDFSNNHFRDDIRDAAGQLVSVNAMDGTYGYWMPPTTSGPLVIQRRTLSAEETRKVNTSRTDDNAENSATSLFEHYRNNPRVELQGKQTQPDGTQVYVLLDRNYQDSKTGEQTYTGSMSMIFDAQTYRLLESETTVHKNGKDITIERVRFLLEETLPADTHVVWDLSDLQGVTIVDEKPAEQASPDPAPITLNELARHAHTYALKTIPDGYTVKIVAAPNQPTDQIYTYEIIYDGPNGENIDLMAIGVNDPGFVEANFYDGSYKAANGMVLNFSSSRPAGSEKGTSAMLTAPDGVSFLVISTFSREQVEALIENLVLLKP